MHPKDAQHREVKPMQRTGQTAVVRWSTYSSPQLAQIYARTPLMTIDPEQNGAFL